MGKNIELELRAEIKGSDFAKINKHLRKLGNLISETKRLSVMFFGQSGEHNFDIRVRVTNGKAELVIKKGAFHAHDRTEIAQTINKEQFLGLAKVFSLLEFKAKVGERETLNYELPDGITASLVKAKSLAYLELEKMSSKHSLEINKQKLEAISGQLEVKIIQSSEEFNDLCSRLDKKSDWRFLGSSADFKKLSQLLKNY